MTIYGQARWRMVSAVVAMSALAFVGACGGSDDDATTVTTTTGAPTTTEAADTSTTAGGGTSSGDSDAWNADTQDHRAEEGQRFAYDCPPGGIESTIWGTETYTDDSSVCNAGVHVGLIDFERGGTVTVEILPGEQAYEGTTANGVTSRRYGPWDGSFIFPEAPPGTGEFAAGPESWSRNAADIVGETGVQETVECSADGVAGSLWGTDVYTADSSICTAAVHAGLITLADGGTVTIEILDGEGSYKGSTANGITSSSYGAYDRSFTFAAGEPVS